MQELMESIIAMEEETEDYSGPIIYHNGSSNWQVIKKHDDGTVTITNDGDEQNVKLADLDKLSLDAKKAIEKMPITPIREGVDYSNEPDEVYYDPTEITHTGDDLHRVKKTHMKVSDGDNPMTLDESLDSFKTAFRNAIVEEFGNEDEDEDEEHESKYTLKKSQDKLDGWEVFEKDADDPKSEHSSDFFDNEAEAKKELKSRRQKGGSFGIRKVTDTDDVWCVMKGNEKIASYQSKEDAQEHIDGLNESIDAINTINKILTEGGLLNDLFQLGWHLMYKLGNLIPSIKADRKREADIQRELRIASSTYEQIKKQFDEIDIDSVLEKMKKSFKATNKSSIAKRDREMAQMIDAYQVMIGLLEEVNSEEFASKSPEEKLRHAKQIYRAKSVFYSRRSYLQGYIRRRNQQVDIQRTKKLNKRR